MAVKIPLIVPPYNAGGVAGIVVGLAPVHTNNFTGYGVWEDAAGVIGAAGFFGAGATVATIIPPDPAVSSPKNRTAKAFVVYNYDSAAITVKIAFKAATGPHWVYSTTLAANQDLYYTDTDGFWEETRT